MFVYNRCIIRTSRALSCKLKHCLRQDPTRPSGLAVGAEEFLEALPGYALLANHARFQSSNLMLLALLHTLETAAAGTPGWQSDNNKKGYMLVCS